MRATRAAILVVLGATAVTATAPAQSVVPAGDEFQVNTYTSGGQARPAIASEDNGDFVVVWQSELGQDGSAKGVFGRRFTSNGAALGDEFQVNVFTSDKQWAPAVALDADGDFVVVWHSAPNQDGNGYGVFGRRYTSAGIALGGEFMVNGVIAGTQSYPSVAMAAGGRFLVTWQSDSQDGDQFGIQGRRYDSDGSPLGVEFQVNLVTAYNQILPAVAISDAGAAVIVWNSDVQDGSGFGIFGRRFDSSGTPLASDFQVNLYTTGIQREAAVGMADDGSFVVTWQSGDQDGNGNGVFARRFDSAGSGGSELQVNAHTESQQIAPSIAVAGGGGFVVTWASFDLYGGAYRVYARRFSSTGTTSGPDVQLNVNDVGDQTVPQVAGRDDGAVVVVWQSDEQDGSGNGVFARRASHLATLDIDGNGSVGALTDGLLTLRFLFGFTDATLISGAVGGGCTRCTAPEIHGYLAGLGNELDIDGNSSLSALTDGLLVLRYLFGFRDDTLVSGVVGMGCTRCDATAIEAYFVPRV